jgi:hypothetical protein
LERVLASDFLMDAWVEPDIRWSGEVLLSSVAKAHDQELTRVRDEMLHPLKRVPVAPNPTRTDDDFHRAIRPAHQVALALFDYME